MKELNVKELRENTDTYSNIQCVLAFYSKESLEIDTGML